MALDFERVFRILVGIFSNIFKKNTKVYIVFGWLIMRLLFDAIDLPLIAKTCGYASVKSMSKLDEIGNYIEKIKGQPGPHLLEVKIKKGSRSDLGRPTSSPIQNKEALMKAFR